MGRFMYFVVLCGVYVKRRTGFLALFRRFERIKLKSGVIVHRKDFNRL